MEYFVATTLMRTRFAQPTIYLTSADYDNPYVLLFYSFCYSKYMYVLRLINNVYNDIDTAACDVSTAPITLPTRCWYSSPLRLKIRLRAANRVLA